MTDQTEQLSAGIDKFANIIQMYKNIENIEIELRMGIIESGIFKPGLLSEDFFNKLKKFLDSNSNWDSTEVIKTEEFLNKGIVQIEKNKIKKIRLYNANFSFENTPYDFRISVSTEQKTNERFTKGGIKRTKTRYSYIHKEYKYDLTYVIQENNSVTDESFEFEIELLNLDSETSNIYRAHSALLKLRDVINFLETIGESSKVKFLKEDILLNFNGINIS